MITESRQDFFKQLEYELERIGIKCSDDIKADFEEHFAECRDEGVSETEAAKRLGDVKEIARSYLNLESTRINSMVARDIERKVSLTKPGRDVPADLSLLNEKQEHFIEYTPEHISEEIYPNAQRSQSQSGGSQKSSPSGQDASEAVKNAQNDVAGAFSNAGRAFADAAKVTGNAIADALSNAGKSAADAVKTAGNSAAEAVKKAAANIPRPNDSFRENSNHIRQGTVPDAAPSGSSDKKAKFIDVKDLKPNINTNKLIVAILLDVFLWSWLLPVIISGVFSLFSGGIVILARHGIPTLFRLDANCYRYYEVVTAFAGIGLCSLGLIVSIVSVMLVKPVVKLVKFIIEMHVKAVYDL